ncbi:MAG: hypothetical protein DWH91_06785 [Planctomycetota bacterium]|nr:MAG: hypothetical protein DWH91_06785 [Planctomycetota bacterium]
MIALVLASRGPRLGSPTKALFGIDVEGRLRSRKERGPKLNRQADWMIVEDGGTGATETPSRSGLSYHFPRKIEGS